MSNNTVPGHMSRASISSAAPTGPVGSYSRAQSSHRSSLHRVVYNSASRASQSGHRTSQFVFSPAEAHEESSPPLTVLTLKHGKVILRVHNSSPYSGFLDLCIAFDIRVESCALSTPVQLTVPYFMHCLPRGLRSSFVRRCTPQPPSTTRTTGIYVRHVFDLPSEEFCNPATVAVLREVHRYSLEDHLGLLISVDHGGTAFASSFLTITSAVASSICFFQRVLVRLGERIAMCMRCSVTEGPLYIAAYQGQYNDADNLRCSYPDVQFVGPTIYASERPRITPHRLAAREVKEPTGDDHLNGRSRLDGYGSAATDRASSYSYSPANAWENEWDYEERSEKEAYPFSHAPATQVRFELRSVRRSSYISLNDAIEGGDPYLINGNMYGLTGMMMNKSTRSSMMTDRSFETPINHVPAESCHTNGAGGRFDFPGSAAGADCGSSVGGSVCLHETYRSGSAEEILPHFLDFLCEHFPGTTIHPESHALILEMPLSVILAAVQLSTILGRACYSQGKTGLF